MCVCVCARACVYMRVFVCVCVYLTSFCKFELLDAFLKKVKNPHMIVWVCLCVFVWCLYLVYLQIWHFGRPFERGIEAYEDRAFRELCNIGMPGWHGVLHRPCCSVLQGFVLCCSVMQCDAVWCSVMQCVAVCCNDSRAVWKKLGNLVGLCKDLDAMSYSVLQCVAMWHSVW